MTNETPSSLPSDPSSLRRQLRELELGELRFRARALAAGFQLGHHLSSKKGPGMEFLGHRAYSPGDDLRHLDRRALLRHRRYLLREFQVETERPLQLLVDASPSMHFAGNAGPTAEAALSKGTYARLLAAAFALLARRTGDPVGLSMLEGPRIPGRLPDFLPPRAGPEQLDRILAQLELSEGASTTERVPSAEVLLETASRVPSRAAVLWFSDFLDSLSDYESAFAMLASKGRTLVLVQLLTDVERTFPLRGPLVLVDPETSLRTETDSSRAKEAYLEALGRHNHALEEAAVAAGGIFLGATTTEPPRAVLEQISQRTGGRVT